METERFDPLVRGGGRSGFCPEFDKQILRAGAWRNCTEWLPAPVEAAREALRASGLLGAVDSLRQLPGGRVALRVKPEADSRTTTAVYIAADRAIRLGARMSDPDDSNTPFWPRRKITPPPPEKGLAPLRS